MANDLAVEDDALAISVASDVVRALGSLRTERVKLKQLRAAWSLRLKALTQTLWDAIEAPVSNGDEAWQQAVQLAYQELQEAEAGRKAELHVLIDGVQAFEHTLDQLLDDINQMDFKF